MGTASSAASEETQFNFETDEDPDEETDGRQLGPNSVDGDNLDHGDNPWRSEEPEGSLMGFHVRYCTWFSREFRETQDGTYEVKTTSGKASHTIAKATLNVSAQIIDLLSDIYLGYSLYAYRDSTYADVDPSIALAYTILLLLSVALSFGYPAWVVCNSNKPRNEFLGDFVSLVFDVPMTLSEYNAHGSHFRRGDVEGQQYLVQVFANKYEYTALKHRGALVSHTASLLLEDIPLFFVNIYIISHTRYTTLEVVISVLTGLWAIAFKEEEVFKGLANGISYWASVNIKRGLGILHIAEICLMGIWIHEGYKFSVPDIRFHYVMCCNYFFFALRGLFLASAANLYRHDRVKNLEYSNHLKQIVFIQYYIILCLLLVRTDLSGKSLTLQYLCFAICSTYLAWLQLNLSLSKQCVKRAVKNVTEYLRSKCGSSRR